MVYSRIDDDKNENQEILSVIRDPFYKYATPRIPDGSVAYSGGIQCHFSFEIIIPTEVQSNIDLILSPSWQVPIAYNRQGNPWTTANYQYENICINKPKGFSNVWNTFNLNPPPQATPPGPDPYEFPLVPFEFLDPNWVPPVGGLPGPFQPQDFVLSVDTVGTAPYWQRWKKWRHVSSAVRIFPVDERVGDGAVLVYARNLSIPTNPNNYSWLKPNDSLSRNPADHQQMSTGTNTRVVLVPDFDPYAAVSNPDGSFKNMRNVWTGDLRTASSMKFLCRPNDNMWQNTIQWNQIPQPLTCLGYLDTSRYGIPLQTTPWNNDTDTVDAVYDRRFDAVHLRIVTPAIRTGSTRVRVEFQGNYEVVTNTRTIATEDSGGGGPVMDQTTFLTKYKEIYKSQQRDRVPGVQL